MGEEFLHGRELGGMEWLCLGNPLRLIGAAFLLVELGFLRVLLVFVSALLLVILRLAEEH